MSVYNIVWADDEIDAILDQQLEKELNDDGFNIVGKARNGLQLQSILANYSNIDAVIVDANFNEVSTDVNIDRDTSGLTYARTLYINLNRRIPFFLFTNRSDELLHEIHKDNPAFLEDFPRHKRWFNKSADGEYEQMLSSIKTAVDENKSTDFIIRNKFEYELNAASVFDETEEFIFAFLVHEYDNNLEEIDRPFNGVRIALEKMFDKLALLKLMPPINDDVNGSAFYFKNGYYGPTKVNNVKFEMLNKDLMPGPLACSLNYIIQIVQDASHGKSGLKLKVNDYYLKTKDTLLLRSVVYILIDCIKWFTVTALKYPNIEENGKNLWIKR